MEEYLSFCESLRTPVTELKMCRFDAGLFMITFFEFERLDFKPYSICKVL